MDLELLNEKRESMHVIDVYESLIWTDRYCAFGDFEIATVPESFLYLLKPDEMQYITQSNSEHAMIIRGYEISTGVDSGNKMLIQGESLESILKERIVWKQTNLNGKIQSQIKKLLDQNVIDPDIEARKIPDFVFEESDDPELDKITIRCQFTGDTIYDAIVSICESVDLGFKVTFNEKKQFTFKLYRGTNRSYNQSKNPYVVFSPSFDNIVDSKYVESTIDYRNVALVAGEDLGVGKDRRTVIVGDNSISGLKRKELFVDARDIQSETEGGTMPVDEYNAKLTQRGESKLAECKTTKVSDGQADTTRLYKYGQDFFMGDIVQLENEYGIQLPVRITEFIFSDDVNGYTTYPTFKNIEEEDDQNEL